MNYKKLLKAKMIEYFPDTASQNIVKNMFLKCGIEKWCVEKDRVFLSILKCSNGNVAEINKFINIAEIDYRDVITLAEYPGQLKNGFTPDKKLNSKLRKQDKKQFEEWIKS